MLPSDEVNVERLPTGDDFPVVGPNALASIAQRAWARIFDELLTGLPYIVALYILYPDAMKGEASGTTPETSLPLWLVIGLTLISIFYEVGLIAWRGQTLGKMLLGIRVAQYLDGRNPSIGQSALRCLLPAAIAVVLEAVIPGSSILVAAFFLSALLNPLRRGWHDLAGGTVVVRKR